MSELLEVAARNYGLVQDASLRMRSVSRLLVALSLFDVDHASGCWQWFGTKRKAYGAVVIGYRGRTSVMKPAHRVMYQLLTGDAAEGLVVDHVCRNRACVNPLHMEAVTNKENVLRGIGRSAVAAKQTACIRGHEYTPENTSAYRGERICRECKRFHERLRGPRDRSKKT